MRAAAARIAGRKLDDFFDRYVRGTDELPLADAPAARRAVASRRAPTGTRAPARRPTATRSAASGARAWTGLTFSPDKTTVRNVVPESPAWKAGLTFNDEIVAVDGMRVNASTFPKRIADHAPGQRVVPWPSSGATSCARAASRWPRTPSAG